MADSKPKKTAAEVAAEKAKKAAAKKAENYDIDLDRAPGARWVTMSNALTRAGHGLTLSEKRIICCAVSTLDSRKAVDPAKPPITRIYATDYAETFGVSLDTAYDQLQDAAKHLYSRSITFHRPVQARGGKALEPTTVTMRWVGQVHYQQGEGWVELYWWPPVLKELTGLQKKFTSYQLSQAAALRSTYTWKLLGLLSSNKSSGRYEPTIETFRRQMEIPASLSDFAQVKRRVIEPAVSELTQKDNWAISWEPRKAGRKVIGLRFTFQRDPQGRLEL